MEAGQTLIYEGKQVCLFPLENMYITQTSSPSSLSHCCGHPVDYGTGGIRTPCYAPCDLDLIFTGGTGNTHIFTSSDEVWTPKGLTYITLQFTHDNDPPTATHYKQGELIYHSGDKGFATGIHLHLDQAPEQNGYWESYGITCSGGNLCYALHNSVQPTEIFFSNGTNIQYSAGYTFEEYEGGVPGHLTDFKKIVLLSKKSKIQRGLIFQ